MAERRGEQTRRRILESAVELSRREGLEGLTIGVLANELKMSKAGLFAHFGSKEELQLSTVKAAREVFIERAVAPALKEEAGLPRLLALCDRWLEYSSAFKGGCFFAAASAEFDDRPGAVRDCVASCMQEWLGALERAVSESQKLKHLTADADPRQVVFELSSLELGSNWARQLFGDTRAVERSRTAILERLESLSTLGGRMWVHSFREALKRRRS